MLQYSQIQRTPRHFDLLADYSEVDYRRLIDMVTWIEKNPSSEMETGTDLFIIWKPLFKLNYFKIN